MKERFADTSRKRRASRLCTAALVVALTITAALTLGGCRNADSTSSDPGGSRGMVTTPEPTPTPTPEPTPTPDVTPSVNPALAIDPDDPNEHTQEAIDAHGGWVAGKTTIATSKQQLVDLVKSTVKGAGETIDAEVKAAKNGDDITYLTLVQLDRAIDEGEDLTKPLVVRNVVNGKVQEYNPVKGTNMDGWTYLDFAAATGDWLFYGDGQAYAEWGLKSGNALLKDLVSSGLYRADVEAFSDFALSGVDGVDFDAMYEVNFSLTFKSEGKQYEALIGNADGKYVVLDVLDGDDVAAMGQPAPEPSPSTAPADKGGLVTEDQVPTATVPVVDNGDGTTSVDNTPGDFDIIEGPAEGDGNDYTGDPGYSTDISDYWEPWMGGEADHDPITDPITGGFSH